MSGDEGVEGTFLVRAGEALNLYPHQQVPETVRMDLDALLAVTPEALAEAILARRRSLAEILPEIERKNKEAADILSPDVEKLRLARDSTTNKVAELKEKRDKARDEARALLKETTALREMHAESGGMKSLDPKWAKEKLEEKLAQIEDRIEIGALSLLDERKLLAERKAILASNDEWLKKRRKANPEVADYIDARRRMQKLFKAADKAHERMIEYVEKNNPIHQDYIEKREEMRDGVRQMERARTLSAQSDSAITYWERRLKDGFGDLGSGYPDLLADANRVRGGGACTVKRRSAEPPKPDARGGDE